MELILEILVLCLGVLSILFLGVAFLRVRQREERALAELGTRMDDLRLMSRVAQIANRAADPGAAFREAANVVARYAGWQVRSVMVFDGELEGPRDLSLDGGHVVVPVGYEGVGLMTFDSPEPIAPEDERLLVIRAAVAHLARPVERAERTRMLQRSNDQLTRTIDELEQLTRVTSHDLKAPVRAIINLCGWIEEDLPEGTGADVRKHVGLLKSRSSRLERLLTDLRRYARAGTFTGTLVEIDLQELVNEVVELADLPPAFEVVVTTGHLRFPGYSAPLRHVLLNLVTNAVAHHDREEGRIEVRWQEHATRHLITFEVADDGPGIDPKHHDRIFRVFQALKRRDEREASGMGLAIVKKTVEAAGGRVSVDSKGRGTTFSFTWPYSGALDVTEIRQRAAGG